MQFFIKIATFYLNSSAFIFLSLSSSTALRCVCRRKGKNAETKRRIREINRKIKGTHRQSQNKERGKAIYFSNKVNCEGKMAL